MVAHPDPDPVGPGQESVWAYPRPPAVRPTSSLIEVWLGGDAVCRTERAIQVLETSHPPSYYLPYADFAPGALQPAAGSSFCEFKGMARYFDVHGGDVVAERAAWTYPRPTAGFEALRDHVAVFAAAMDRCTVDGEVVTPQPGGFYGGWVTRSVAGPIKGVPGSAYW